MAIDYSKKPNSPEPTPAPGGSGPAGAPAGSGGLSLSKVTLTKSAPTLSLSKSGATGGTLRVHLAWNARPAGAAAPSGGFLSKLRAAAAPQSGIDLDLGALYEFTDGSKGVVQALGNAFRDRADGEPTVWLDGDDRSGGGGENLFVDLRQARKIKRVLVFAFIYEGVPNWAAADGVVTLFPTGGPEVEVRLDEHDDKSPMCAIAQITSDGTEIAVQREVRYVQGGQQALDEAFGWGMKWRTGRK